MTVSLLDSVVKDVGRLVVHVAQYKSWFTIVKNEYMNKKSASVIGEMLSEYPNLCRSSKERNILFESLTID